MTQRHATIDGIVVGPLGRGGLAGDAGIPVEFEVHPGIAIDGASVGGAVALGGFAGYRYFGIGYVYGFPVFPFRRPSWMASHRFGVRAAVPIYIYNETETRTLNADAPP